MCISDEFKHGRLASEEVLESNVVQSVPGTSSAATNLEFIKAALKSGWI